jgi:hypothetical protein
MLSDPVTEINYFQEQQRFEKAIKRSRSDKQSGLIILN